jgi:hypothetical protein
MHTAKKKNKTKTSWKQSETRSSKYTTGGDDNNTATKRRLPDTQNSSKPLWALPEIFTDS